LKKTKAPRPLGGGLQGGKVPSQKYRRLLRKGVHLLLNGGKGPRREFSASPRALNRSHSNFGDTDTTKKKPPKKDGFRVERPIIGCLRELEHTKRGGGG